MRQYGVDEKGEEHIIHLFIENWWASDRESLLNQTPSKYFIDAWEETEVLQAKKSDLTYLVDNIPVLTECMRKLEANFAIASQNRISAAISLPAKIVITTWKNPILSSCNASPSISLHLISALTGKHSAVFAAALSEK